MSDKAKVPPGLAATDEEIAEWRGWNASHGGDSKIEMLILRIDQEKARADAADRARHAIVQGEECRSEMRYRIAALEAGRVTLEDLTRIHEHVCSCGGAGPGEGCPACEFWHEAKALFDPGAEGMNPAGSLEPGSDAERAALEGHREAGGPRAPGGG